MGVERLSVISTLHSCMRLSSIPRSSRWDKNELSHMQELQVLGNYWLPAEFMYWRYWHSWWRSTDRNVLCLYCSTNTLLCTMIDPNSCTIERYVKRPLKWGQLLYLKLHVRNCCWSYISLSFPGLQAISPPSKPVATTSVPNGIPNGGDLDPTCSQESGSIVTKYVNCGSNTITMEHLYFSCNGITV